MGSKSGCVKNIQGLKLPRMHTPNIQYVYTSPYREYPLPLGGGCNYFGEWPVLFLVTRELVIFKS